LTMKMFVHCGTKAKDVIVQFSNRFLASNSKAAANQEPPMDFDRALNLAGTACYTAGYAREPPALPAPSQSRPQPQHHQQQRMQAQTQAGAFTQRGAGGNQFILEMCCTLVL